MKTIYAIKNKVTGEVYVGCAKNFKARVLRHRRNLLKSGYKQFSKLYPAMAQYGLINFEFAEIEKCKDKESRLREQYWIRKMDSFKRGYNATVYGGGGISYWKGKKRSAETKEKVRASLLGRNLSDAHKKNISNALKGKWPKWATIARQNKARNKT